MRTRIKFCGLTREADVDAAVEAGADALGFVFYPPSPRAVDVAQAAALVRRLPAFVSAVGLFVNEDPAHINAVADAVGLSHVQLHGDEPPEQLLRIGRPVLKALRLGPGASPAGLVSSAQSYSKAAALLLDADSPGFGGAGHAFDWRLVAPVASKLGRPWVLSGGLHAENVAQALHLLRPSAVDVSSGIEALGADGRPQRGLKDPGRMLAFAKAVREADDADGCGAGLLGAMPPLLNNPTL